MNRYYTGQPVIKALLLIYALLLAGLAYGIQRENFTLMLLVFTLLFLLLSVIFAISGRSPVTYGGISKTARFPGKQRSVPETGAGMPASAIMIWVVAGIMLRAIVLFSIPAMSDDYFRFIWDGMLTGNGINPYLYTPEQLMRSGSGLPALAPYLASNMNSAEYYSVYPAVCQAIFAAAWLISGDSVFWNIMVMRFFIFAAETGTLFLAADIIRRYDIDGRNLILYALNPVVIMELTANLHFEAVMIFFLIMTWWLFLSQRFRMAALAFALAVHVKLVPLILLPYIFFRLGYRRGLIWCGITGLMIAGLFMPLLTKDVILNMSSSLGLYFHTFEFNAGPYYLVREIGYLLAGYNIIGIAGPLMAGAGAILILALSYNFAVIGKSSLPIAVVLLFTTHLFFSTTVHPWYIMAIVAFSVFSGHLFPVIWSVFLPLSYHAYVRVPYTESVLLVIVTYFFIIAAFIYGCRKNPEHQGVGLSGEIKNRYNAFCPE